MEASELLNKAADLIEEHGWTKGVYQSTNGAYCLMGAMDKANDGHDVGWATQAMRNLIQVIHSDYVINWNDYVAQSKEEVVQALRKAALL